jgi:hypothetical protein
VYYKGGKRTYFRTKHFKNKYCHFGRFRPSAKRYYYLLVCLPASFLPNGATPFPLGGFSWNFMCENVWKICQKIQFLLNSHKNKVALREGQYTF